MRQAVAPLLVLALSLSLSCTSAFHAPVLPLGRASSSLSCASQQHAPLFARRAPVGHARPRGAGGMLMSLYEDQEKAVVRRGELEEQLMSGAPTKPLQAPTLATKRAAGGGGKGFSASQAGSKKSSISAMQAQGKAFAKVMRKDGVCYVPDVLTPEQADALREWITGFRGQAEQDVSGGVPLTYRFADVLLRQNRADLKMPIGQPLVMDALTSILSQDKGVLGHMATELLGGDPELYELSCLISDPGSQRQIVHADTPYGGQGGLDGDSPVIFTFFIALQDVKEDMGATVWLPGTHTRKAHDIFAGKEKDELLRTAPIRLGMLPKGCMGAFDSRLLHCGGANRSGDSRAIFYLSFKNAKVANAGNPGSISPELVGALRLSTLQKELGVREEVGNSDALDKIVAQMR